jgi:hypothetical protein
MLDFASFETFNPDGAGLGNLFNPISPLESLGVWPSGDFRLDPGAGFAPAFLFYAGGALALAALVVAQCEPSAAAKQQSLLPWSQGRLSMCMPSSVVRRTRRPRPSR